MGSTHFRASIRVRFLVISAFLLWAAAGTALAGPGSGTAQMWPVIDPQAGTYNRWTIRYTATEDFDWLGGMVSVDIPVGWSAPQVSDSVQAGFVRAMAGDADDLDSVTVSGQTIRLYLGGKFFKIFRNGEYVEVIYGASSAFARTQTVAQDSVEFTVKSDPDGTSPQALTSGSPTVNVVAGTAVDVTVYFAGSEAGDLAFTADDNSNVFSVRGEDAYGNPTGGVACTWSLSAGIGTLSGGKDSTNTFDATTVGTGYVIAEDDFGHIDSTGVVTVTHGSYSRLDVAQPGSAVAGAAFQVSVAALDADGNVVTSGPGSDAGLWLSAWLDSLGTTRAAGSLSDTTLSLAAGVGTATEVYTVAEAIYVRAVDTLNAGILDFGPAPTVISAAPPSVLDLVPDTLFLEAGSQGTFTVLSRDVYGNVSPVSLSQTLFLWTNSPSGIFRQREGAVQIFDVQMPADSSRAYFDYYDTNASEFLVAVMDADTNAPTFPVETAYVVVDHSSAAALDVSGVTDPVIAGTVSDVVVAVNDAHGNRVKDYTGTVQFSSTDGNPQTILPPDYTFAVSDSGRHVFPLSVTLTTSGEQSVIATDALQPSVNGSQGGITVVASACDALVLTASASWAPAGSWLDVDVEGRDVYGNRATGYTGVVGFSCTDAGDSTVLPPYYQFVAADSGFQRLAGSLRLTTSGVHTLSAADTSQPQIDGDSGGLQVVAGSAASVVIAPGGSFNVNAGGTQVLSATVRDSFGNLKSGEQTSVVIKDSADGSLEDDPANPNNTSGGASIQTGNTDASGVITVLYRASQFSGRSDTMDAYCTTVPHDAVSDVFATSTPAGATALRILPASALADTAAAVLSVSVEAIDSFGNLDTSDTSLVRLTSSSGTGRISVDGGASWSVSNADSLRLVSGSSQSRLKLTDTAAGNITLLAEDTQGALIDASKGNISLAPAFPAGTVSVYPVQDTLTADGTSFVLVGTGPFTDAYGNNVGPGTEVTATSLLSKVVASDVDSVVPGIQVFTAANGIASFALRAGSTAGSDTVRVSSVQGTAAGSVRLVLLSPPRVQYVAGSISPAVVAPGQVVSFSLQVRNIGGSRVYLVPSSAFTLEDGNDGTYTANLPDTVVVLAGGGTATLTFQATAVPVELDAGSYSPILSLTGYDGAGSSFTQSLQAGTSTVSVVSIRVRTVLAQSSVTRGGRDVPVQMTVENPASVPLQITATGLTFSSAGHIDSLVSPALPDTLQAGEIGLFSFEVDVDQLAPLGPCTIDGFASGSASGVGVSDSGADSTAAWSVQSPAVLSYVSGSLSRRSVSVGQTHSFSARIMNSGTAPVALDTSGTYLAFGPQGSEYVASLAAPILLGGARETSVQFEAAQVSLSLGADTYSVGLFLSGTENGASFSDTLYCDPDSVTAQLPAVLEYVAVQPETLSTGYEPAFEVTLRNIGQATAFVQPQTRISFGSPPATFLAFLSDSLAIEGDSVQVLRFSSSEVDTGFTTGRYLPELLMRLRENGVLRDSLLATGSDSILVQRRAALEWVAGSLSPLRVTRGQVAAFTMQLANTGDAPVSIDPALCDIRFRDAEREFLASGQGAVLQIASQSTAQLSFVSDTVHAAMANQVYRVDATVEGVENGVPFQRTIYSPQGELSVQSPALLRYLYGSVKPGVVAQGQDVSFSVGVENIGDATLFVADSSLFRLDALADTVDCSGGCAVAGHGITSLSFKGMTIDGAVIAAGSYSGSLEVTGTDWNGFYFSQTLGTSPDSVTVSASGDVRVYSTVSSSPNAPYVDTSQTFQVGVEIENLGQEEARDVVVQLSTAGGSLISGAAVIQSVQGGSKEAASISVQAAAAPGAERFTAQIQSATGGISGLPLSVAPSVDDTTEVTIQMPARLTLDAFVQEPQGATDGTLSTGQNFKIGAAVTNLGEGAFDGSGALRISIPAGFVLLSPATQPLVPGVPVEWSLSSPASATGSSAFLVSLERLPGAVNTGQEADTTGASRSLYLSTVERASLSLALAIVAPPAATDGSLRLGETFTLEATVLNGGTAAVSGSGRVALSLPSGYSISGGASAEQDFSVGVPVRWNVTAPSVNSSIEYITATISGIPDDENTNAAAHVSLRTREIGVYAESKDMVVEVLPLIEPPLQVVAGELSVRFMALRIENPVETGEGSPIGLRSVTLYVTGEGSARLLDPSAALSAVKVSRYSAPDVLLGIATGFTTNPVRVDLSPVADTLATGQSDTLLVAVDVSQSPRVGGVALEIEDASAFDVFDAVSGNALGVVGPGGGSFQGVLTPPSRLFAGVHNYPNPFQAGKESTAISYYLNEDSRVSLKIYTLDGKLVFSVAYSDRDQEGRRGLREIEWDGRNGRGEFVLSGVYICKLEANGVDATFKIAVAK
ncbi:MAG: T9SS type A sorting domain-containing protein [Candidatus Eiseniibacteriota bacterium]|nr:MAG: T9SS type A sorting domain-containing protein [Candidatus Eisenbacteria bacterium]